MLLTISKLRQEAIDFCKRENSITHDNLVGVTDGKAVGTYIEHKFEKYLENHYEVTIGSSAKGIDLPDPNINTDIKVTSIKKPQSSSPFRSIEQKVYGLGHNLLIFIYEKTDVNDRCYLEFKHCIFIESEKTADYNLTKALKLLVKNNASRDDIIEILKDFNIPSENNILKNLADKIISNPPEQGYLTISNAFQWRLKYNNILSSTEPVSGVHDYQEYTDEELGDYQTPLFFTDKICSYLKNDLKIEPDIIIEPSCGIGNFITSASNTFNAKKIIGIDNDSEKLNKVNSKIKNLKLINENIFNFRFNDNNREDHILIIGNLPQITNSKISNINSDIMHQTNFKKLSKMGLKIKNSNFDISEYIILKLIDEFKDTQSTFALLCKRTIARNVFIELVKNNISYSLAKQLNFSSSKIFKIDSEACLFIIQFGGKSQSDRTCGVSDFENPSELLCRYGFIGSNFYPDVRDIPPIDSKCQLEWRQGVKHDCAKIMELDCTNGNLTNKNNENIDIEPNLTYPLLKAVSLKNRLLMKLQDGF